MYTRKLRLIRREGRVYASLDGRGEETVVKLVWARPLSGRGEEVSVIGEDRREVALLKALDGLDPDSRRIAEQELDRGYLVPKIIRVWRTQTSFGSRYWDVETDRGEHKFTMRDPGRSVVWIGKDKLSIRDTLGNRYEIESFSSLDRRSRAEIEKVV